MLQIIVRVLLIALLLFFTFAWKSLNCIYFSALFLLIFWAFLYEVFTYLSASKYATLDGLLKEESFLKKVFSGKFIISIKSIIIAFSLTIILFLGLSIADNFIFFLSLFGIFIFFALKKLFEKNVEGELSYGYFYAKKWIFFITSLLLVFIYAILLYFNFEANALNPNFVEYLRTLSHNPEVECLIAKEIYVFALFVNDIKIWVYSMILGSFNPSIFSVVFVSIFIAISLFAYFFALSHIYSFIISVNTKEIPNRLKPGLFIKTLLVLAFITLSLFLSGFLAKPKFIDDFIDSKITKSEKAFRFVFGSDFIDVPLSQIPFILEDMNKSKTQILQNANNSIDFIVDSVFNEATPKITKEMADWYFSVLTDYTLLYSWAKDGSVDAKVLEEFEEIFDKHFPKDMDEKFISVKDELDKNFSDYLRRALNQYEINSIFKEKVGQKSVNVAMSNTFDDLRQNSFKRLSYSAGITATSLGIVATLGAKTSIKLAGKVAGKLAIKSGASVASGSAGVVCGPFVVICAPVFAGATWFGVDYAITKLDESFNREEFERDITSSLEVGKERLKDEMKNSLHVYYDEIYNELEKKVKPLN
ncbi:MAG: hypothetical protein ACK5LP_05360 [Campylobacteraceae bacterium]